MTIDNYFRYLHYDLIIPINNNELLVELMVKLTVELVVEPIVEPIVELTVEPRDLWSKSIQYRDMTKPIRFKEICDFIIVGAGSAGCVFTKELIENIPNIDIVLRILKLMIGFLYLLSIVA
ncbi:hypothetical protein Glove_64g95 [Diversispora epigaea]|uniref:Glucose-methanol-choline oxidoreductase N-terminal domain-containing protein n=1 Tax=Diversispora epigaea TaxID=1348612 RepID=A0A397JC16_9GLOM|nr:hypothetical protein Glove_64g95 [Diversispora epigaea]